VSISFQHTHHLKRGDDVTSEKKAKKLLGREKRAFWCSRLRAFFQSLVLRSSRKKGKKKESSAELYLSDRH
jgi:hypothetical protein